MSALPSRMLHAYRDTCPEREPSAWPGDPGGRRGFFQTARDGGVAFWLLRFAQDDNQVLAPNPGSDATQRCLPAGVEGVAGLIEVDHQRRVVRRDRLSFPGLAIDLGPHGSVGHERVTSRWSIRMPSSCGRRRRVIVEEDADRATCEAKGVAVTANYPTPIPVVPL